MGAFPNRRSPFVLGACIPCRVHEEESVKSSLPSACKQRELCECCTHLILSETGEVAFHCAEHQYDHEYFALALGNMHSEEYETTSRRGKYLLTHNGLSMSITMVCSL